MKRNLRYVFGPVPSRRLGRSLGVNPIPFKTCNYSCVYCQLGHSITFTNERKIFYPPEEIAREIKEVCSVKKGEIDYITFVGEGEPTLYSGLYDVSKIVKDYCDVPLAIISNGALFSKKRVIEDVLLFDVLLLKVDANNETLFKKINRPHKEIHFDKVIEGFISLKETVKGKIWIETMLVKGLNDDEEILWDIRKILDKINPKERFVTIPTRPPAEEWVRIPDPISLFKASEILKAHPIYDVEHGKIDISGFSSIEVAVLNLIKRHPIRIDELRDIIIDYDRERDVEEFAEELSRKFGVKIKSHLGFKYLLPPSIK